MFVAILSTILLLLALSEWHIWRTILHGRSARLRGIYYLISALCTLPYLLIWAAGHIWDIFSPIATTISQISIILLLINATLKILHAAGSLLAGWFSKRNIALLFDLLALAVVGVILYGHLWERKQLRTTEIELLYPNLPDGANGVKIVQFGDLHIGLGRGRYAMLEKVAERVNEIGADIVVDCGDITNSRYTELDSTAMQILSRIKAPLGVYTVIGNHDNGMYIRDTVAIPREENIRLLMERQRSMGWHNITDTTIPIAIGGDTLYLSAIDYPKQIKKGAHGVEVGDDYSHHFADLPDGAFNIVLAHTPVVWSNILAACEAELTLSGHVHSMQLKLPLGERGWSPAALIYEHWSGLYHNGLCALNITDGVGSSLPMRVGVKPEIVVITLRKSAK